MNSLLPRSSCLALFGALAVSGYGEATQAAVMAFDPCPAQAGIRTSWVVDDGNPDDTAFDFKVCNTSQALFGGEREQFIGPYLRDWELPYFGDEGIDLGNIRVPEGWMWSIEDIGTPNGFTGWEGVAEWQTAGDPFKEFFDAFFGGAANNPYNSVSQVLHFYTFCTFEGEFDPCILPGDSLEGFGFDANFSSTNAPYQASWAIGEVRTGDPNFPLAQLSGAPAGPTVAQALANRVPEPGTLAMLGAGLGLFAASRRRKSKATS